VTAPQWLHDPAGEAGVDPKKAVTFDLDALEREGAVAEQFTFQYEGESFTMLDPQDIDWQNLLSGLRNPALFIRFAMPMEAQKRFFAKQVPAWKMNKLMAAYQEHYGIPDLGNANALHT
jgi:hypothetical protein